MTNKVRAVTPNINQLVAPRVQALIDNADALRLGISTLSNGTVIIDAGIEHLGGIEAGRLIGEICLGGLGTVAIRAALASPEWPWRLDVWSSDPVIACLASQYAGWSLQHGEGKGAFFALGSGPGRAMGSKEELFTELGYRSHADKACLVLEVDKAPPVEVADKVAGQCEIEPADLTLILTPTTSLAGAVQVVARVLEVSLHKVHTLEFPLDAVIDGLGSAPMCPPSADFVTAMGRTNDAILFGGQVQLYVDANDEDSEALAKQLPSSASKDYGLPFAEVFKNAKYDFYKIDPLLFSPARVIVTSVKTGHTFHGGKLDNDLLNQSFGGA